MKDTDAALLDKTLTITVPDGYIAYIFADEKAQFRIEPCSEKKIASITPDDLFVKDYDGIRTVNALDFL